MSVFRSGTIKIIQDQVSIKKQSEGWIYEIKRTAEQKNKSFVYRKLGNGIQFGGILNQQQSGTGKIVDVNEEYYMKGCQIENGVVISNQGKFNLVTHQQIEQESNLQPILSIHQHERFDQLVGKLYQQYLSRQIHHKIVMSYTQQTSILLDLQKFQQNKIQQMNDMAQSKKNSFQQLRKSYEDFIQIFICFTSAIDILFVVHKCNVWLFGSKIETTTLIAEFLKKVGYKVQVKSIIPVDHNKDEKVRYYAIPLILKILESNDLNEGVKNSLKYLQSNYKIFKQKIQIRTKAMAENKILVTPLEKMFDTTETESNLAKSSLK